MSLTIEFGSVERVYKPGETVSGNVFVDLTSSMSHNGMTLHVEGVVKPQLSPRSVGLFEAFYTSMKPITLLAADIEIAEGGRLEEGETEFPFEFDVVPVDGQDLLETYHGVYVNVTYEVSVTMVRGAFAKDLAAAEEFYVQVPSAEGMSPDPSEFTVTPESLENVKASSVSSIPDFRITGKIHKRNCLIDKPFTGELRVEASEGEIQSIELQLVRVETVTHDGSKAREATEILNLQLAEGDVARDLVIPMYLIFPRLFTCPTTSHHGFTIDFEVNVIILFKDNYLVTENCPIQLYR